MSNMSGKDASGAQDGDDESADEGATSANGMAGPAENRNENNGTRKRGPLTGQY